jgi:hypothetical protein
MLGGLCRSTIEWYDFFIYLAALVFPAVFLPAGTGAAVLASPIMGRSLS